MGPCVQKVVKTYNRSDYLCCLLTFVAFAMMQGCGREPSAKTSCAANLAEIQGAKIEWSKERHRSTAEIPTISDLVGATNYLQHWPECPDGGTYNIRSVKELPECSVREHVYPGQPLPSQ